MESQHPPAEHQWLHPSPHRVQRCGQSPWDPAPGHMRSRRSPSPSSLCTHPSSQIFFPSACQTFMWFIWILSSSVKVHFGRRCPEWPCGWVRGGLERPVSSSIGSPRSSQLSDPWAAHLWWVKTLVYTGLLRRGKYTSRNEGAGLGQLGGPCGVLWVHLSLAARTRLPHLPRPGHRGSQHSLIAAGTPRVLALDVLVDFFAGPEYYRDGKSWCPVGQFHGTTDSQKVYPFSTLLRNHFLKWITFLSPRFFSKNIGTILFASFLLTLSALRLNCRVSVILPSQVTATEETQSIPPAKALAYLLAS